MDIRTLFWVKDRPDHVSPIRSVHWRIKDPSKFGWTSRGPAGSGQISELNFLQTLLKFPPTVFEVVESPNPVGSFFLQLSSLTKSEIELFFSRLIHLKVQEWPKMDFDDLKLVLENSPNLLSFDFCDTGYEEKDFYELVAILRKHPNLEALDLNYPLTHVQLDQAFAALAQQKIKTVRLSVPYGISLSDFCKATVPCSSVEFLVGQELIFEDASQDIFPAIQTFQKLFPNLKFCFLDWNLIDPEVVFDDRIGRIIDSLYELSQKTNLIFLALLLYVPTEENRASGYKIGNHFSTAKRLSTRFHEFSSYGSATNFLLITVGKQDDPRMQRLIEVVVEGKNSRPDLRQFTYILKGEAYRGVAYADLEIEFGGLDREEIKWKLEERKNRSQIAADRAETKLTNVDLEKE